MTEFLSQEEILLNEEQNENNQGWEDLIFPVELERKCGEVLLLNNFNICFICVFCDERFPSIDPFLNHIKRLHIDLLKNESSKKMYPCPDDKHELDIKIKINETSSCDTQRLQDYEWVINKIEEDHDVKTLQPTLSINSDPSNEDEEEYSDCNIIDEFDKDDVEDNEDIKGVSSENNEDLPPKKIPKKRNRRKKIQNCAFCDYIGRDRITLESHMRYEHNTGTRHQCEECGKCFRNRFNLNAHLIIHAGTRPFKCEFCDAGFSHPNSLKSHRFLHTGNRPHKCSQCDKGFVSTSALRTHMREHTGEMPYVCHFCSKRFATQSSFKRHTLIHMGQRNYVCSQCDKSFVHKHSLNKHMICHTNERNFACDVCEKKFSYKKNLTQHKKLHLDIKPYVCKVCKKGFKQYAGLYSHKKSHENKGSFRLSDEDSE